MSRVYILAADKKLPLCDHQEPRTGERRGIPVTILQGFQVAELNYYRQAVEELGYPMKPFRYEFTLEKEEQDLMNLRTYLEENLSAGETLELWSVWLEDEKCPPRYTGRLDQFDRETLEQFLSAEEICLTITK